MNTSEILLDFDEKYDRQRFYERLAMLMRMFNFKIVKHEEKRTKHGFHIRLWTDKKFDNKDIVFFQLFLGSDYKREAFNWLRVRSGVKHWNVLFKKKYDSKLNLISEEKEVWV